MILVKNPIFMPTPRKQPTEPKPKRPDRHSDQRGGRNKFGRMDYNLGVRAKPWKSISPTMAIGMCQPAEN